MKFKISNGRFFLYFVMIPYLKPYNITLIPSIDAVFKVWKVIASLVITYFFIRNRPKMTKSIISLYSFLIVWFVSLLINNGPIGEFVNNIMSIVGVKMLFDSNKKKKYFKEGIVDVLYNISWICIVLNLITVIMGYPFGAAGMKLDDNANFLGGDNYSAFILITFCGFIFFHDEKKYNKITIRSWIVALMSIASLIITFSIMGILAHLFLFLSVMIKNREIQKKIFRWQNVVIVGAVIFAGVSFFHLDKLLASLLLGLDKVGFNGRNLIWPMAVEAIAKKPFLGYGGVTKELAQTWFLAGANHTHNILLEYPFSTGIIGTFFFLFYLASVLKNTKKSTRIDRGMRLLLCTLSAYIFCGIMDFYIGMINLYLLLEMINVFKKEFIVDSLMKTRRSY